MRRLLEGGGRGFFGLGGFERWLVEGFFVEFTLVHFFLEFPRAVRVNLPLRQSWSAVGPGIWYPGGVSGSNLKICFSELVMLQSLKGEFAFLGSETI